MVSELFLKKSSAVSPLSFTLPCFPLICFLTMNDPMLSIDSYLYLHPNESPAVALVSPPLDSSNYHSWSRSMMTALSAKNKVEFVNGKAPEPLKYDRTHGAWSRCNNMVVSWLVHSVSIPIRQSVLWMDKAEEIWNDLKSRCAQGDLLRVSELQQEASSIKQGSLSVTEYFTKLRVIWDEIENFRPNPVCHALSSVLAWYSPP